MDSPTVTDEDPRRQEWLDNRDAALWHLRKATTIARGNLGSGSEDWQRVFDILSGLATNYRLDLLNVAQNRPVWHLPEEWIEVRFANSPEYQAVQMSLQGGNFGDED